MPRGLGDNQKFVLAMLTAVQEETSEDRGWRSATWLTWAYLHDDGTKSHRVLAYLADKSREQGYRPEGRPADKLVAPMRTAIHSLAKRGKIERRWGVSKGNPLLAKVAIETVLKAKADQPAPGATRPIVLFKLAPHEMQMVNRLIEHLGVDGDTIGHEAIRLFHAVVLGDSELILDVRNDRSRLQITLPRSYLSDLGSNLLVSGRSKKKRTPRTQPSA
jgi:hypothetical protein